MVNNLSGSPPRIRGKLCGFVCGEYDVGITPAYTGKTKEVKPLHCQNGITPAYTGKTFWKFNVVCVEEDHPRVYGENLLSKNFSVHG